VEPVSEITMTHEDRKRRATLLVHRSHALVARVHLQLKSSQNLLRLFRGYSSELVEVSERNHRDVKRPNGWSYLPLVDRTGSAPVQDSVGFVHASPGTTQLRMRSTNDGGRAEPGEEWSRRVRSHHRPAVYERERRTNRD
jgi:hypothetical protein